MITGRLFPLRRCLSFSLAVLVSIIGLAIIGLEKASASSRLQVTVEFTAEYYKKVALADSLSEQRDYDGAIELLKEALALAEFHDLNTFNDCLLKLANTFEAFSNHKNAIEYYERFLGNNPGPELDSLKAIAYSNVAKIYTAIGSYGKAYEYHLEAILIEQEFSDNTRLCSSYYNIGILYFYYLVDYEEALKNFLEAKKYAFDKDERYVIAINNALGATFERLGNLEQAFYYNNVALEMAERLKDQNGVAYALQNIGTTWMRNNQLDLALDNLQKSLVIFEKLVDRRGASLTHNYIGDIYVRNSDFFSAKRSFEKGLSLSKEINLKHQEVKALTGLALVQEELGNLKIVINLFKRIEGLRDSLANAKALGDLAKIRSQFEIAQREKELKTITERNQLLENQKILRNKIDKVISALLVLGCIFFCFLLYSYQKQKRVTNLIAEKNKALEELNSHVELQNTKLEYANTELTQFAYVASHDLKEPLRTISSFSKLILDRYGRQMDSFASESFGFIIGAVDRMKLLLDDLLTYSRIDRVDAELDDLNLGLIINDVISNLIVKTQEVDATIDVDFGEMPQLAGIRTHFMQLFQHLISNGIKFKKKGVAPHITIDCVERNNDFTFRVADNGIGIPEKSKLVIFEMFTRLNNKHRYSGTGIGLATCKKIVDFYGGHIWVESEEGVGSTFYVRLPKNESETLLLE